MTSTNKLSAAFVAACMMPGRYADGNDLYLQVSRHGEAISKQWLFRFQLGGRSRQMGLGSVKAFSLAEARARARGPRQLVADKVDPIEARDNERRERETRRATRITFQEAAERFITGHEKKWAARHTANWRATLASYVHPLIGRRHVDTIGTADIIGLLEALWQSKPQTASRVRGRIEQILDWCKVRHLRSGENPAAWRGRLSMVFAKPKDLQAVTHLAATPYARIPSLMASLTQRQDLAASALRFAILTATRTGEVLGARWSEIDLEAATWTVPASRMKAGREHVIPLADAAVELLRALPRVADEPLIFPGRRHGKPIRAGAMLATLKAEPGCEHVTVHGMRSAFRDWAGNETSFARELAEEALAHAVGSTVERAYRRSDALEKRRKLMEAWSRYCGDAAPADNVTALFGGEREGRR